MAAIFNGVAMDFGAGDLAITAIASKIGTFKVQSWDMKQLADKDVVKDANGVDITVSYYNPTTEATFETVVSGTGLANALTQTLLCPIGTIAAITSTNYTALAGTNWIVEDSSIKASNTKNKMIAFKLKQYPAITAAAGA